VGGIRDRLYEIDAEDAAYEGGQQGRGAPVDVVRVSTRYRYQYVY
jgi:hypothetical protein